MAGADRGSNTLGSFPSFIIIHSPNCDPGIYGAVHTDTNGKPIKPVTWAEYGSHLVGKRKRERSLTKRVSFSKETWQYFVLIRSCLVGDPWSPPSCGAYKYAGLVMMEGCVARD